MSANATTMTLNPDCGRNDKSNTSIKCPDCGSFLCRDNAMTLASNPPKTRYYCTGCGFAISAVNDNDAQHIIHNMEKKRVENMNVCHKPIGYPDDFCDGVKCHDCSYWYPQLKYKPIDPEEKDWIFGHDNKEPEDVVNHPSHYETGKFECFDVMREAFGDEAVKNFCICNAFKYLYRHKRKNGVEDIRKAKWYIDKFLEIVDEGLNNE